MKDVLPVQDQLQHHQKRRGVKEEVLGLQERWATSAHTGKSAFQHGPTDGIVKTWPGFKTCDNKPALH